WCAAHDMADILARFEAAQGTIAPVYSIEQIFADPQFQERDAITRVPDDDFGSVRMQNVVPRFVNEPGAVRWTAGELGAHNEEVYGGWLGIAEQERQRLEKEGII